MRTLTWENWPLTLSWPFCSSEMNKPFSGLSVRGVSFQKKQNYRLWGFILIDNNCHRIIVRIVSELFWCKLEEIWKHLLELLSAWKNNVGIPGRSSCSIASVQVPVIKPMELMVEASPRRIFANAHTYHINSISVNSDQETYLSADDLRINLWHLEITDQSFNIVDIKPANMEELTEVSCVILLLSGTFSLYFPQAKQFLKSSLVGRFVLDESLFCI